MGTVCLKRGTGKVKREQKKDDTNIGYTFKWTALSDAAGMSCLDAKRSVTLGSEHHDQANQIHQHSGRRPKSRAQFLYRQTRVHHHYRSALRRETALDRIANSEGGDASRVVHAGRR